MEAFQKVTPTKVWSTKRDILDDDISKEQLFNVLHNMDRKSLGMNGFPFEFSKMMWYVVQDELLNMVRDFFLSGRMGDFQNQGLIKLIPKNAAKDNIECIL